MGEGLEVQPGDLHKAAKDYVRQSGETKSFRTNFESAARLDPDDFANTSSSWKLANNYEETYNQVLADIQGLSDALNSFAEGLDTAATNYEKMEDANTVKIKKGDTLWDISKNKLGDPTRYPEIAKNNPQIKDPDLIYPGQTIKVRPDKDLKLPWPPE